MWGVVVEIEVWECSIFNVVFWLVLSVLIVVVVGISISVVIMLFLLIMFVLVCDGLVVLVLVSLCVGM